MNVIFPQSNFLNTYDFLETLFNRAYHAAIILSLEGEWLQVNDSLCRLLGYNRKEIFDLDIHDLVYRDDIDLHVKQNQDIVNGIITEYQVEQRYFCKNGSLIWVLLSASIIYDQYGKPSHLIWQLSDITTQKKIDEEQKMLLNVAREQNERLTAFADIITHNLRSHSGNLSTITTFLEDDFYWLKNNENYDLLKKAINNLEDTVSHLTEVAKIKELEPSEIKALNLYDYVEKAIYNIAAIAKNTNTDIINNIDSNLYVKGIPAYLDSIILNFLTNAIKYRSDERLPKVKLTSSEQNDFVVLNIADNGLGIDLEMYGDKLFQMYKTFHKNKDAIGIGLFITKSHIESLGGKVIVKSEVNKGSEFSIYLKRA